MFTATFYSYKGGVGRTMALVNVAAELARNGRRVLLVDFDLEAPGISSYREFSDASMRRGIVEYVGDYLQTSVAPRVEDYIFEANFDEGDGFPVWVMPAGIRDSEYGAKLASIDWQELYEARNGFLLFEDLRQQWAGHSANFDYVLIDSRTGYTDVGGICTRQLADLVVLMFVPNEQNINGLSVVTADIREDAERRNRNVSLLFCASNVPNLDDEEGILRGMLDRARGVLRIEEEYSTIHHYESLALIHQTIFTLRRARTTLAEEYRSLVGSIIRHNLRDREGALLALRTAREVILKSRRGGVAAEMLHNMERAATGVDVIGEFHRGDGEISWNLALIYQMQGRLADESAALGDAIIAGYLPEKSHLRRAMNALSQGRKDEARVDLEAVLGSLSSSLSDVNSAVEVVRTAYADWDDMLVDAAALRSLDAAELVLICNSILTDLPGAKVVLQLLDTRIAADELKSARVVQSTRRLALIATGQFEQALESFGEDRKSVAEGSSIEDVFNYAMTEWGDTGSIPYDLLERTVALDIGKAGARIANYLQCLALCHALLGNRDEALTLTVSAINALGPGKSFSCWRYLYSDRTAMTQDLEAMRQAIIAGVIRPAFLEGAQVIH